MKQTKKKGSSLLGARSGPTRAQFAPESNRTRSNTRTAKSYRPRVKVKENSESNKI